MPPITTLLLVVILAILWVAVVAGVWAVVSGPEEYPPEVSRPTKE
jgi:hypothetical protein